DAGAARDASTSAGSSAAGRRARREGNEDPGGCFPAVSVLGLQGAPGRARGPCAGERRATPLVRRAQAVLRRKRPLPPAHSPWNRRGPMPPALPRRVLADTLRLPPLNGPTPPGRALLQRLLSSSLVLAEDWEALPAPTQAALLQ